MYRVVWVLPEAGDDHTKLVEDVLPPHVDDLAREGCWKLVAGVYPHGLLVEMWTDSDTTADGVLRSDAGRRFLETLGKLSDKVEEARGAVDEVVTMHISALRMG